MSYQVCPLCQGKGGGLVEACSVCQNKYIIDDKSGKPPTHEATAVVAPKAPSGESKPEELVAPLSVFEEPTDDEILYYATPYYDVLQEQKADRERKQKEGKLTE